MWSGPELYNEIDHILFNKEPVITDSDVFQSLAYPEADLAAFAVLIPIAKVLADLIEGDNKILIGVTIVAIYLAILTIANRIWEVKEDSK